MSCLSCLTGSSTATTSPPTEEEVNCPNGLAFRVFVVVSLVLAAIIVVAGVLALMATQEALPSNLTIVKMAVIGEPNAAVMIAGGCALFAFAVYAWKCYEDNQRKSGL